MPVSAEPESSSLRVSQPRDNATAAGLEEKLAAGLEEGEDPADLPRVLPFRDAGFRTGAGSLTARGDPWESSTLPGMFSNDISFLRFIDGAFERKQAFEFVGFSTSLLSPEEMDPGEVFKISLRGSREDLAGAARMALDALLAKTQGFAYRWFGFLPFHQPLRLWDVDFQPGDGRGGRMLLLQLAPPASSPAAGLEEGLDPAGFVSRDSERSVELRERLLDGSLAPGAFVDAVLGAPFRGPPAASPELLAPGASYRPRGVPMDAESAGIIRRMAEDHILRSTAEERLRSAARSVVEAFLARLDGEAVPVRPMRDLSDNEAVEMMLELVRVATGVADPYAQEGADPAFTTKRQMNEAALQHLEEMNDILWRADTRDPLRAAVALGIIGNAIDFADAGQRQRLQEGGFDVAAEIARAPELELRADLRGEFAQALERDRSRPILFLVDNAGEIVFDLPLIRMLMEGGREVIVAGKEMPHANDMTAAELREFFADPRVRAFLGSDADFQLRVISSGTCMTGCDLRRATPEFAEAWREAGIVYAKGQGMIETLRYALLGREIFHAVLVKTPKYFSERDEAGDPLPLRIGDGLFLRTPTGGASTAGLEEGLDPEAAELRRHLLANPYPGGPLRMAVDAFRREKADVVVLADPPSLEVFSITQPVYSAFNEELVRRLAAEAGLRQIFIQTHPRVARELSQIIRAWRSSNIPDLWSFLRLHPDAVSVTNFVSGNMPGHWLGLFRAAADMNIPVHGLDPGEYFVDHRNVTVGDPMRDPRGRETAEKMAGRLKRLYRKGGKALVLADPHHASRAPEMGGLAGLLKEGGFEPEIRSIWAGVGDGNFSGSYTLYDTELPSAVTARTAEPPLSSLVLAGYPAGPLRASHCDGIFYFRTVEDVPLGRVLSPEAVSHRALTFDEAAEILARQGPLERFLLHGALRESAETYGLSGGAAAEAFFVEEAGLLLDGQERARLYDLFFQEESPGKGKTAVAVGYRPGMENRWESGQAKAGDPEAFPLPGAAVPEREDPVWERGGDLWPDHTWRDTERWDNAARVFASSEGFPIPPLLGPRLVWAPEGGDLFRQEVEMTIERGLYLDGPGVSPAVRRYIRQAVAKSGLGAEAVFTPLAGDSEGVAGFSVGMLPIHVWFTGQGRARTMRVRWEGRVPVDLRRAGTFVFRVDLRLGEDRFRLDGRGWLRMPGLPLPRGLERHASVGDFLNKHGNRLSQLGLKRVAERFGDQAAEVLVVPGRPAHSAGRVHVAVHAGEEQRQQEWERFMGGRLSPGRNRSLPADFEVAPYPADGKLPAIPSVVVRQAGASLPADPSPSAPVVLVSVTSDMSHLDADWLHSVALDEELRGKEIGPVIFSLTWKDAEGNTWHAIFA